MKLSISMTRRELLFGGSYLLISLFALPFLIFWANTLLPKPLSEGDLNIVFFAVNFLAAAGIFHRFLIANIRCTVQNFGRCLRFALFGLVFYFLASELLAQGILWLRPDFFNVNDANISSMDYTYPGLWVLATVFFVPIAEELFYRGLLFQGLHNRSRLVAYGVSAAVFAAIHVLGYIGMYDPVTLALCYIQYIPAGICLAWAYEKSDTIITPILMHITINQIGIAATR